MGTYGPRSISPLGLQQPPAVPPKPTSTTTDSKRDREHQHQHQQQPQPQQPQQQQVLRKKPPSAPNPTAAVGILKALDPHAPPDVVVHPLQREYSDEYSASIDNSSKEEAREREARKEKKGFWERAKEREREREKEKERNREKERKEEEGQAELTRMIGAHTSPLFIPKLTYNVGVTLRRCAQAI